MVPPVVALRAQRMVLAAFVLNWIAAQTSEPHWLQRVLVALFWVAAAVPVTGQTHETEHTLRYNPADPRPKATVQDLNWLEGDWEGTAFGGVSEEIWSGPLAGTMMGVYRSIENGVVKFYEINAIVEVNGSLEMRLKHFHSDFTGWEEKDVVRSFPLVKIANGELDFDGMTYKKTGNDTVTVYLAISSKEGGGSREMVFEYKRKTMRHLSAGQEMHR